MGVLNMEYTQMKNLSELWINGKIDETKIEKNNKPLFDKIDDELIKKWGEHLPIFINDIVYSNYDFENICEMIINGINNNIDNIVSDLLEIAEKYKNETIKL